MFVQLTQKTTKKNKITFNGNINKKGLTAQLKLVYKPSFVLDFLAYQFNIAQEINYP